MIFHIYLKKIYSRRKHYRFLLILSIKNAQSRMLHENKNLAEISARFLLTVY